MVISRCGAYDKLPFIRGAIIKEMMRKSLGSASVKNRIPQIILMSNLYRAIIAEAKIIK